MELFRKYADMALLAHFLRNPTAKFSVKEAAERLGLSPSSVSLASRRFELDGILKGERKGQAKLYSLNNEAALVRAFKVTHTLAMLQDVGLVGKLLRADGSLISIALFGGYASGAYDERSDLNLLVLSQKGREVFAKPIRELEERLGLRMRLEVFKLGRWKELARAGNPLYRRVLSNHLMLYGSSLT